MKIRKIEKRREKEKFRKFKKFEMRSAINYRNEMINIFARPITVGIVDRIVESRFSNPILINLQLRQYIDLLQMFPNYLYQRYTFVTDKLKKKIEKFYLQFSLQRNEFRPKLLDNTRKYSYPNYPLSLVKRFNKRDIYSKLISKGSKISLANSRVLFRSRREDQEREREIIDKLSEY